MILYLDTPAILKLYFEERGSVVVRQAVAVARIITCHRIAYAEARAAFAAKSRERKLNARQAAACREDFERDWSCFDVIEVTETLVRRAGDLAEHYTLRGYNSVHLAAAEAAHRFFAAKAEFRFAVFDGQLLKAAQTHGLTLLGPD